MKTRIQTLLAVLAVAALFASSAPADDGCCAGTKTKTTSTTSKSDCCATAATQTVSLKIQGRDCMLDAKLEKLAGVSKVETCSDSGYTTVAFASDKNRADRIIAAVRKAGYKVESRRLTLAVDGLTCESCSDKVTAALSKVKGVSEKSVCHESKKAVVDFDPSRVKESRIIAAINATGFKATEALN